jgi:hypothetical protein
VYTCITNLTAYNKIQDKWNNVDDDILYPEGTKTTKYLYVISSLRIGIMRPVDWQNDTCKYRVTIFDCSARQYNKYDLFTLLSPPIYQQAPGNYTRKHGIIKSNDLPKPWKKRGCKNTTKWNFVNSKLHIEITYYRVRRYHEATHRAWASILKNVALRSTTTKKNSDTQRQS